MHNRLKSALEVFNTGKSSEIYILDEILDYSECSPRAFRLMKDSIPIENKIKMYINSPGGSVFPCLAIYNMIKPIASRVEVHIIGAAWSAASFIGLSAGKIVMRRNALMMLHNPSAWGISGEEKDLEIAVELLKKAKEVVAQTYTEKSGKSKDEIYAMMEKTTWLTADEALEHGFIDEVSDEEAETGMYEIENLKDWLPANIYNSVSRWRNPKLPAVANSCHGHIDNTDPKSEKREMKNLLKVLVENKVIASADADEADVVIALKNSMSAKDLEIENLKKKNEQLEKDAVEMAKAAANVAVNAYVESGVIEKDEVEFWIENYLNDKDRTVKVLDNRKPKKWDNPPLNLGNQTEPEPATELEKLQNNYDKETDPWKRGEIARNMKKLRKKLEEESAE